MPEAHRIGFEAYGVPVVVGAGSPALLSRVEQVLPPASRVSGAAEAEETFALTTLDGVSYWVQAEGGAVSGSSDLDVALDILASELRQYVALRAPGLIFVHAGVAAYAGRAIVIPGRSFSGKSTLVAELVRAGATYYSDEYAVLDRDGLVHPYAKPISLRTGLVDQTDHAVETFGGTAGADPVPIGLVVAAQYRPGAEWRPRQTSAGEGVLALMANTVPAQERPEEAMAALRRAINGAVVLEGERGEAAAIAPELLAAVSA